MPSRRPKASWFLPGRVYDLAFGHMLRKLRKRVAKAVETEGLYPWLDVCCGTGDQLRGHVPKVRFSDLGSQGSSEIVGRSGGTVCGLDMSLGFLRYAAARAPGVPFVCGDAGRLPFKDGSLRAISLSFGLHDKIPDLRTLMMSEARRTLAPDGRLIVVDFETPWNAQSRAGALFAHAVERMAGGEHYRNGREFLKRGGLRAFLRESGFVEVSRRDIATGSLGVVVARADSNRS